MAIDKKSFIDNFLVESRENIVTMGDIIIALRKEPDNNEKLSELLRLLHTLKGSSRMMDFRNLEAINHELENIFKGVKEKRYPLTRNLLQLIYSSIGYLEEGLDRVKSLGTDTIEMTNLQNVFRKAESGLAFTVEELEGDHNQNRKDGVDDSPVPDSVKDSSALSNYESIRVKITKIDEIVKQLNSLIIQQFQFKRENETLSELEEGLRGVLAKVKNFAANQPGLEPVSDSLGELTKMTQKIRKTYSDEMAQLEHISFELQEEILGLQMLPLNLVLNPLKKMVEETSLLLEKEIDFQITGSNLLIDKTILENINDPIIHLIRNAVDHGIESPQERAEAGKDSQGSILIQCTSESGRINIRIRDDGRGINYDSIRAKAIELNPEMEDEIRKMDNGSLSSFLFQSGFTTTKKITNLSGRGVGLDIVKTNIEKIKGKIIIDSKTGEGTLFEMSLPLSLATVDGFFVKAQGKKFLIPTAFVKEILIIKRDEIVSVLNKNVIRLREMIIPVYPLAALLGKENTSVSEKLSVVVVESLGDIIGITVDSVIQFSSLIYKPLPGRLSKLKVIQGIVFDENFEIINILFVPELISRFKGIRNIEFKERYSPEDKQYKQILVVDDSLSTREIEKSILELENFNVSLAVDGIDALDKMKEQYFHLIITDVQMPRMDGITLIENVRRQEKYKKTPVIVISSNERSELEDKVKAAGGNAIINKNDFDRGSLLERVRELIG